jgi:hypothetical protein
MPGFDVPEPPIWVKLGLWGLPNRASIWAFFWISVALAVGSVVAGFWDARFFAGGLFVFSAWWYWAALRWVDEYGMWPRKPQ